MLVKCYKKYGSSVSHRDLYRTPIACYSGLDPTGLCLLPASSPSQHPTPTRTSRMLYMQPIAAHKGHCRGDTLRSMLSIVHRCHLRHSATARNECEMMCEGGSARASRSAMRCHATHLYRPMRSLQSEACTAGAAGLPSDPGRRTSAPGIEVWDLRKVP